MISKRITENELNRINKYIELKNIDGETVSTSDVISEALKCFFDNEFRDNNEYNVDKLTLEKRSKSEVRFNEELNFITEDTDDIINELNIIKEKYHDNRSKNNILLILRNVTRTLGTQKKYEKNHFVTLVKEKYKR